MTWQMFALYDNSVVWCDVKIDCRVCCVHRTSNTIRVQRVARGNFREKKLNFLQYSGLEIWTRNDRRTALLYWLHDLSLWAFSSASSGYVALCGINSITKIKPVRLSVHQFLRISMSALYDRWWPWPLTLNLEVRSQVRPSVLWVSIPDGTDV